MPRDYLHNHPQFADLIRIVSAETKIDAYLVEKDYWLMHCLYGLQQAGMIFEMKGGTSLSKGFRVIDRFSEDIDIRIEPPAGMDVKMGRNQDNPSQVESRKKFYDWLAERYALMELSPSREITNSTIKNIVAAASDSVIRQQPLRLEA